MQPDAGITNVHFSYACSRFTSMNRLYIRVWVGYTLLCAFLDQTLILAILKILFKLNCDDITKQA